MIMIRTLRLLSSAFLAMLLVTAPEATRAEEPLASPNLAIQGYDPMAYFTDGRATKGKPEISHVWDDEKYQFTSAANREQFSANPERYAPNFTGYCAAALSMGMLLRADPEQWLIIDGKLYFFVSARGRQMVADNPALLKAAEANWKHLRKPAQ